MKKIVLMIVVYIFVLGFDTLVNWLFDIHGNALIVPLITTLVFIDIIKQDKPRWED